MIHPPASPRRTSMRAFGRAVTSASAIRKPCAGSPSCSASAGFPTRSSTRSRRRTMREVEPPHPRSPMRVLIVDDSSLVRLYYRAALERSGLAVEQAINGLEAMEKVLTQPFDLVIVDINMPGMDGISFVRSLRRSAPDVATLPVLVIT